MATPQENNDAGRMVLTNATPYAWKRSLNKPKGMKTWNFPEGIAPGASVICLVAFKGGDGAHGQASYQVCEEAARIKRFGPRGGHHTLQRKGGYCCRLKMEYRLRGKSCRVLAPKSTI